MHDVIFPTYCVSKLKFFEHLADKLPVVRIYECWDMNVCCMYVCDLFTYMYLQLSIIYNSTNKLFYVAICTFDSTHKSVTDKPNRS